MLWIKSLHIIFVVSWFAGLFYLPRIFVNLAQVSAGAERDRLLLMARKLLRFMTPLAVLALVFGLALWLGYGIGVGSGWMAAKLVIVLLLVLYHVLCAMRYAALAAGTDSHSHIWYRWFNEVPVLLLAGAVVLVVVKPF